MMSFNQEWFQSNSLHHFLSAHDTSSLVFFSNTAITSKSFHPAAELEILVFSQIEIKVALSNINFPFVSAQFNILSSTRPITVVMSFFLYLFCEFFLRLLKWPVTARKPFFSLFYFSTSFLLHNNKTVEPQIIGLKIHNCLCASFATLNYKQAPSCLFALNSACSIIQ